MAGAECIDGADAPKGWTKWIIPGYEYLYVESEGMETFSQMITYLADNNLELVGAAYDFTEPKTQQGYMYFPIRKL